VFDCRLLSAVMSWVRIPPKSLIFRVAPGAFEKRNLTFALPELIEVTQVSLYQRRECKLTEVRIRPLPIPVISVMKSELCDFRVTK